MSASPHGVAPRGAASRWRRPAHVLVQQVGTVFVVLDLQGEIYHILNASGKRMWDVLLDTTTEQEALEQLAQEFDVAPVTLTGDYRAFVEDLVRSKLVQSVRGER